MTFKKIDTTFVRKKNLTRFDWVVNGMSSGPNPICDKEIFGTSEFSVIPSKGSIVPGWSLIIPKKKTISLNKLKSEVSQELLSVMDQIESDLSSLYNDKTIVKFEHGPCNYNSLAGCGVDQAHLHLVPLNYDFKTYIFSNSDELNWITVDSSNPWKDIEKGKDYYLIWLDSKCYVSYPLNVVSQYFRRKIAEFVSLPNEWDYKLNPHYKNVNDTIERFNTIVR